MQVIKNLIHSIWSVCEQWNSLCVTAYTPDDGPCETETCRAVVGGYEIGVVKPEAAQKPDLKTVFVYVAYINWHIIWQ
jgi:hypothetical protein